MKKSFTVKKFVRLVCGGGLLGLISLSLVGVGFSSWLITSKDSPSRDTPLDSIGADGEFSDINQYLNIDSVDTSDFVYNSNFGFLGPNGEVISGYKGTLIFYGSFSVDNGSLSDHISSSLTTLKMNCFLEGGTAASVFGRCVSEAKLAFNSNGSYDFNNSSYAGTLVNASNGNEVMSFPASVFSGKQQLLFGIRYTFNKPSGSHNFTDKSMSVFVSVGI